MATDLPSFYLELFEYNHHFNQELINRFLSAEQLTSGRCRELLNHLVNVQQIWNNRILPEDAPYGIWEQHATQLLKNMDLANHEKSVRIISSLEFDQIIQYANSKGQVYRNKVRDILFHVINHGTYHRGQIAVEFRNAGIEPLITDYIFYKR